MAWKACLQGMRRKINGYMDKAVEIISAFVKECVQQKQELSLVQREDSLSFKPERFFLTQMLTTSRGQN